jgi:MoaD family protein
MALIRIPSLLRSYTRNEAEVRIAGATIGEVLQNLERSYPGIGVRLFDETGTVRRYVNVFHNDEDIRSLQELATPVAEGDRIMIVPATAGG